MDIFVADLAKENSIEFAQLSSLHIHSADVY